MNKKTIITRGRKFTGIVTSTKAQKTATIEWERKRLITKYERYERKRSKVKAHVPDNIEVQPGDKVIIGECRPISKTKRFIILEKVKQTEQEQQAQKEKIQKETAEIQAKSHLAGRNEAQNKGIKS